MQKEIETRFLDINKEELAKKLLSLGAELEVSDMDKCGELLRQIGLEAMRKLEKYRHTFELDGVTIDIDTWPKIPTYVEVEGPSVKSLQKACDKLDLDWEKRFDGDAREVFRHYGHDLDKISVATFSEFR